MSYRKRTVPGTGKVEDLEEHVEEEFSRIEETFNLQDFVHLICLFVEPERPRDGLTVYADGTEWNPGSGEGVYTYYGAAWHKLG